MTDAEQLEQRIREGIPLAAQMDFRVLSLMPHEIQVSGGAGQNVNVHGTAFAGSQYAIATLALWGLVNTRLPNGAELVLAEGRIAYRRPIIGEIYARCRIPAEHLEAFLSELAARGRARLNAEVTLTGSDKAEAADYRGTVHARLPLPNARNNA